MAQPTIFGGYRYRSKAEADYAANLEVRLRVGKIRAWCRAESYRIEINGQRCGRYTPDFVITHLDGSEELIEVKGWPARDFLFRFNVFRASRLDLKITVVGCDGRPYDPNHRERGTDAAVRKMVREGRAR